MSKDRTETKMLVIRGKHYLSGKLTDFYLSEAEGMVAICEAGDAQPVLGGDEFWVAPGLIDLQVNGYQGRDFVSGQTTIEDVVEVAEKLVNAGVTGFCPTVTTNSPENMERSLKAIGRACDRGGVARDRVLGIHLEGPYISSEDGPRGAHPLEHVREPDWDEFMRFQDACGGRIRLITLAPEKQGALDFICKARKAGVLIAIGHHAATGAQIDAAVSAGAVLSTHLGNGAHGQLPRHPNYIWDQLAHDGLMASMIVDGHHLAPGVVKSFFRVKGAGRLILVSDVVAAAGLGPGRHTLMGQEIDVLEDESVKLSGTPYLAGSSLKLCDAVANMMLYAGATLAQAIQMATENPAILLNLENERGFLRIGNRPDLTVFREKGMRLGLAFTIAEGVVRYEA